MLEENMQVNKSKIVFNTVKTITRVIDTQPSSNSIRSASGDLLSNPTEVKQRWFDYGNKLYNHKPNVDPSNINLTVAGKPDSEPTILRSEVEAANKRLKAG